MSQNLATLCKQMMDDFEGKKIKNFLEVILLEKKTGQEYIWTVQRKEGKSPAMVINELKTLIGDAAPLTWVAHQNMDDASEWEKKAVALIK